AAASARGGSGPVIATRRRRRRRGPLVLAVSVALGLASLPSCDPIIAIPLSNAPVNACTEHPCDRYERGARVRAHCGAANQCGISGRLELPYWIVVNVPETSIFAPGMTFVLSSDALMKPPE